MRFFRRKATTEDEAERCPQCSERVPEGADHCFMCGADLRTLSPRSPERPVNTPADAYDEALREPADAAVARRPLKLGSRDRLDHNQKPPDDSLLVSLERARRFPPRPDA